MDANLLGAYGEVLTARYLRKHGFIIIDANYSCRFGEIDLIAEDNDNIVFVEVKTRSDGMKYSPADAVDASKRSKIIATSKMYLQKYNVTRQPRFDIVEVYFDGDNPVRLNHLPNAFDGNGK